ncbi:MAG: hypothetical protein H6733_00390 [Alphaproteobacteria bacterium]|nr:hypothetical protein [Alphaproteobacteria bacterium]
MTEERPLYVARPEDVAALADHWSAAKAGTPRYLRVVGPFGGGRRALVAEFLKGARTASDDLIVWSVGCTDNENGVQWLMRMYGSLVTAIAGDVLLRGKVEMVLNGRLPSETRRVQGWYQAFVQSLREAKPDPKTGQVQLRVSQDNPLIGLVEIVRAISSRIPIVLDLQLPYVAHTMIEAMFLEALVTELGTSSKFMLLAQDEPAGTVRDASHPAPLLDLYARHADVFLPVEIAAWGEADTAKLLASKGLSGNAARIAEIAGGRPGFIAELVDILADKGLLDGDLADVSFASLVPMAVDEEELELPDAPPAEGERKHAGPDDAAQVAFLAALLGQAFPSALVAEMGGYDKESIDDLIDAMDSLFAEVQFNEQMNTWIYRFARGSWREGIMERNDSDEGHELARRVGVFMERFLAPRGIGFIARTARIYAEHGAPNRAANMRALALTGDDAQAWGLVYELMTYFDEASWTDTARRTVYMTLLDHLAGSGQLAAADRIHGEVTTWATSKEDRDLQAWLLLNGSKLDLRRQDLYRARDRARDALKLFEALENKGRLAEVHVQLASIALADGKPDEAIQAADAALTTSAVENDKGDKVVPQGIAAQSEMVRGAVARNGGKLPEAIEHFRRANQIAGTAGLGPVAIDAGLAMSEAMIQGRQIEQAAEVLERILVATRQIGAAPRERAAAEMLAQCEGARRNFPRALQLAQRCLQISQGLRAEHLVAVDQYHVGFFLLAQNKGKEGLPFLEQAEARLSQQPGHPLLADTWYYTGIAALQAQQLDKAKGHLTKAVAPLRQSGRDPRKLASTLDQLAAIAMATGAKDEARRHLTDAIAICDAASLKDERKALAKKLESIA